MENRIRISRQRARPGRGGRQRKLDETRNAKKTRANNRGGFPGRDEVLSMVDEHGCLRIRCHINNQHHRTYSNSHLYSSTVGKKPGVCFSRGKAGHWNRECPLTTGLSTEVQQRGGTVRKLSVNLSDIEYIDEDVGSFPSEVGEDSGSLINTECHLSLTGDQERSDSVWVPPE